MENEDMTTVGCPSPAQNGIGSDSDDDEPMFISRKKKHVLILEDSDDEDDQDVNDVDDQAENSNTSQSETQTKRTVIQDDSDDSDDEDYENQKLITRKSGIDSDNSDESDHDDVTEALMETASDKELSDDDSKKEEDQADTEDIPAQSVPVKSQQVTSRILASDIFDAETDSDDDGKADDRDSGRDSSDSDNEEGPNSSHSEGEVAHNDEDMTEMSAALKKRLKKGASKSGGSQKSQRPHKENVQDIHSETQRIVRESSVRLPYHKPEKVGLSVFLARSQQKQEQLQTSKLGLAWKQTPEIKPDDKKKRISSASRSKVEKVSIDKLSDEIGDKLECENTVCASMDTTTSASVDKIKKDISKDLNDANDEDWDNLPDLVMEKETTKVQYEIVTSEELSKLDAINCEGTAETEAFVGVSEDKLCKPEESGYISIPTSEEENSGDHSKTDVPELKSVECTDNITEQSVVPEDKVLSDIPDITDSPITNNLTVQSKSFLTPKLVNLSLDKLTPKLSGTPDSFIDFDEDEGDDINITPKIPAGIEKLMERMIKHSAKRSNKPKDIEISLVSKEQGANDKEELKLKKLTYHVDEEVTSPTQLPGAKLTHLKEKLQEKMRLKRCEARQRRDEVMSMDNEEGYGEDEVDELEAALDDEAEMTDGSDTDSEEDEVVDEEELLAAEDDDHEEEEERENNPFMDNEADEDDDSVDEDDNMETEDELHLKLDMMDDDDDDDDDDDSQSNTQPIAQSSARKDFLQNALQKSKTTGIDLFDEDANTESPTMSQHSNNGCPPEISSRPFQQLSGDSTKTLTENIMSQHDDDILLLETQSVKSETVSMILSRDISLMSADSSFEGTLIPAGQRTSRKNKSHDRFTPDLFTPSSKSSMATINKNTSHVSDVVMPVDDSQDLLVQSPSRQSRPLAQSAPLDFHFQLEETQSQMLDDEGLFKVSSDKKPARRQLMLDITRGSNSQNTEDELLGLCSGKFTEDSRTNASKSLFSADSQLSSQNNMDELIGLCSGRFTGIGQGLSQQVRGSGIGTQGVRSSLHDGTGPFIVGTEENSNSPIKIVNKVKQRHRVIEEDSNDSFVVASCGEEEETEENDQNLLSEDDDVGDDEDGEVDEEADSDDEEMQQARIFRGFKVGKKKGGKMRQEFVDEEAELSGSEYDSDENLDIAAKDDILELEAGDMDDVGTEEQLRDQVGRVHLKSIIDQDKRELQLIQEMYLQDGDLHTDGAGRERKFRWRNIDDDDTQHDLFKSDDEAEPEEGLDEQQWRVKRYEREKFIQEQKEKEEEMPEDDGLIKLGKIIFRPKKDNNSPVVENEKVPEVVNPHPISSLPAAKENFTKPRIPSHGSFLRRNKATLAKIAELSKPASKLGGARQSGNFVFTARSPDKKEQDDPKRPQVKRSMSAQPQTQNKRQKLERSNSIPENSIFRLM